MQLRRTTVRTLLSLLVATTALRAQEDGVTREPAAQEETQEDARLVAAMERLKRSRRAREALEAAGVLADALPDAPDARTYLQKAVTRGSVVGRAVAVKTLGERGDAAHDLLAVQKGLEDASPRVRLTAVLAIRRLGSEGFNALARFVLGEPVANNRKMAVKTFQLWNDPRGVDPVLRLLERENDPAVRRFCVAALQSLTRQDYGDDVEAWKDYRRAMELRAEMETGSQPSATHERRRRR